jgi:transporter family protein
MTPWVLYAFLAALTAALVGVFSKIGIAGVDATVATALRGAVIALFMGGAALVLGRFDTLRAIEARPLFFIVLTGIAGGLSWFFGFLALKYGGDATAVNAIDKLSIVLLLGLAILFLGEAFTWWKATGAALIVVGTIFMSLPAEKLASFFRSLLS